MRCGFGSRRRPELRSLAGNETVCWHVRFTAKQLRSSYDRIWPDCGRGQLSPESPESGQLRWGLPRCFGGLDLQRTEPTALTATAPSQ